MKDGRVWALLGEKGAGKTSVLAAATLRGLPVTGDDLVVLRGTTALSGPAALDLRRGTAEALGCGDAEQLVRDEVRWRVYGEAPPAELPFAGFVLPAWGAQQPLEPVTTGDRLQALARNSFVQDLTGRERRLLDLLDLPMLRWSRPQHLPSLAESVDRLVDLLP